MAAASTGLSTSLLELPTGITMEVIHAAATGYAGTEKPPLVFVPGSYHAAWCWKYFQPFFAARGYPSYAISVRGSGLSTSGDMKGPVKLDTLLGDLDALYASLNFTQRPVVVGHSTGGLVVQQWAATSRDKFSGGVLLASKPPVNHNDLTWRITEKYGLRFAWRITTGFAFKRFVDNLDLTREVFFSDKGFPEFNESIEGDDVLREYMKNFETSKLPVDLKTTQVPVRSPGDLYGRMLVLGGELDRIIDVEALKETAEFFGVPGTEVVMRHAPHDLMLSSLWKTTADAILDWLDNSLPSAQ